MAPAAVSHFLTQCVFCFFAEDAGLLPGRLFERLVGAAATPERLRMQLDSCSKRCATAACPASEWTERVPEVVPLGMATSPYPDRIVARSGFDKDLAKRTLTNLYNQRPAWLAHAHDALDAAVATAYGWPDWSPAMPEEDILRRLLALNRERAAPPSFAAPP